MESLESELRKKAESLDISLRDFMHPIRVAITGSTVSPPLLESIQILGVDEARRRVDAAVKLVNNSPE